MTKEAIEHLYLFIDWVMTLPAEWEERYDQQIEQFEKAHQMEYITSMERRGIKKGLQKGELASLSALLKKKFPSISLEDYKQALENASGETLLQWIERVLDAHTPEEVFKSH